jgi:hypothetical protein
MGRYYHGDIEGKFMFAVQSSTAADRFGCTGFNNYVTYYFDERQLPKINEELESMQDAYDKVTEFFKDKDTWNSQQQEEAGISSQEMSDYADYRLGVQIRDCILEQGYCEFEAEL